MNITEVKIYPLIDSKTLALVSINIGGDFIVSGLKILNGINGLFVAMPNRKSTSENSDKKYYDIAFPITKEARTTIQNSVLEKYNQSVEPHLPIPKKNQEQIDYDNNDNDFEPPF